MNYMNDDPYTHMWIMGIFVIVVLLALLVCGCIMIYSAFTKKLISEPEPENFKYNYFVYKFYYHTRGVWGFFCIAAAIAGLLVFYYD